jgi:GGDEF domain-containing protein
MRRLSADYVSIRGFTVNGNDTLSSLTTTLLHDQQTGLPSMLSFCIDLQRLLTQHPMLALIIMRIDPQTHAGGENRDDAAAYIARLATDAVRRSAEACVYRTASQTFAVVLPDMGRAPALQLAETLRIQIEQFGDGLTATFAVAGAPQDAGEAGALIAVCEAQFVGGRRGNRVYAATPVESLPPTTAQVANVLIAQLIAVGRQIHEAERVTR